MKKVLILKTVDGDMTAHGDFLWPRSGYVSCPDWSPKKVCGCGLHGLLWGEGNFDLLDHPNPLAVWIVAEVDKTKIVDLGGKVKFPECNVIYAGKRDGAIKLLLKHKPSAKCPFVNKTVKGKRKVTVADFGKAVTGNYGKAVSGDFGIAIAGDYGLAKSGDGGISKAGFNGKAISGDEGKSTVKGLGRAISGSYGRSVVGDYGIAKSGDFGFSKSGSYGKSITGYKGTAVSGKNGTSIGHDYSTVSVGVGGKAKAGIGSTITISYLEKRKVNKLTKSVGWLEEDLQPNIFYKVKNGIFVKA